MEDQVVGNYSGLWTLDHEYEKESARIAKKFIYELMKEIDDERTETSKAPKKEGKKKICW